MIESGGGLDEPAPSVAFVDAARVVTFGSHFGLPTADFHPVETATEEDAAVAVSFLLEFEGKVEVFEFFFGAEVTVLFVGSAFANEVAVFDVPFFPTVLYPAGEVFAVEKGGGTVFTVFAGSGDATGR